MSLTLILSVLFTLLLNAQVSEIKDEDVSLVVEGEILKGSITRGAPAAAGGKDLRDRVALFISGSGASDRDGNSLPAMQNNSLKYLAHAITRSGVSTLRVDKRGVAASKDAGLKEEDLRFQTYVDDITSWIDFLTKRGFKEVILVGHSEGALVATLAAKHPSVISMVSLAGAGRPASDILKEQLEKNTPENVSVLAAGIIDQLVAGKKVEDVPVMLQSLFRPSVQPYLISWFQLDPAKEIAKLNIPVLVIQGSTDIQISEQDAKLIHQSAKNSKLHIIKGMNHVLKKADGGRLKQQLSYLSPDLPLIESLAKTVSKFLENPEGYVSK